MTDAPAEAPSRPGRILAGALARHVHAHHLRHKATGRVREAEILYDRAYPKGACSVEVAHDGRIRLISPDGSQCIHVDASDEGRLFRYASEGTPG